MYHSVFPSLFSFLFFDCFNSFGLNEGNFLRLLVSNFAALKSQGIYLVFEMCDNNFCEYSVCLKVMFFHCHLVVEFNMHIIT